MCKYIGNDNNCSLYKSQLLFEQKISTNYSILQNTHFMNLLHVSIKFGKMAIRQTVQTKVTIVVILLLLVATMFHLTQKSSEGISESQPKMPFLDKSCVRKLTDMQDLIDSIKNNSKSPDCKEAWDSLSRIYDIHISDDKHITIPSEMRNSLIKSMKGKIVSNFKQLKCFSNKRLKCR